MKHLRILKTMVLISTVFLSTHAMSSEIGPEISLYNIGTGYIPYTYHNGSNEYLGFNYAYELSGSDYPQRSTWNIIYNQNGTVSFRNNYRNVCMKWYGTGYGVIQETCNTIDEKQQFNLKLTDTGALLVKFKSNNECLYANTDYMYSGDCATDNPNYLWAIIPPLKGSSS
ncbi:MAG: hypothetical protein E6K54_07750 [Gammaproteobacteria bacterium]|nr:MAG: hypothetical protein E6K54_07750 [Gammaproteobacteria bacterium]